MKKWPDKNEREEFEITEFINSYERLKHGRRFKIIDKSEKPDYLVEDEKSGERFGVELTSVYISDRSVPDEHKKDNEGSVNIQEEIPELDEYKRRLIAAIDAKIKKAENYDLTNPLILSIYVNEYCSIFLDDSDEWKDFIDTHSETIDKKDNHFSEIVFWSLPNDMVISVIPE